MGVSVGVIRWVGTGLRGRGRWLSKGILGRGFKRVGKQGVMGLLVPLEVCDAQSKVAHRPRILEL